MKTLGLSIFCLLSFLPSDILFAGYGHDGNSFSAEQTNEYLMPMENCSEVPELVNLTAPLLERYLNIGLPAMLYRKTDIDMGKGCKLQFQINRNGAVYVTKGQNSPASGSFTVHIPVDVVDCRVDCKQIGIKHHEDIQNMKLTLMSTVSFKYIDGKLTTEVFNDFTWNDRPYFTVLGIHVSVTSISEAEIRKILQKYNEDWKNALNRMFQKFELQDCDWMPLARGALKELQTVELSETEKAQLRDLFVQIINKQLNN